jgi:hypothetical protein
MLSDGPAMGARSVSQFTLGFGKADIDAGFTSISPGHQKLECNCGFDGARAAFQKVKPVARHPASQDEIQAFDARRGSWQEMLFTHGIPLIPDITELKCSRQKLLLGCFLREKRKSECKVPVGNLVRLRRQLFAAFDVYCR